MYKLGPSDELRCRAVPYRKGACWRDMMGDGHYASMLQPMMIELSEEQWNGTEDRCGPIASSRHHVIMRSCGHVGKQLDGTASASGRQAVYKTSAYERRCLPVRNRRLTQWV